MWDGVTRTDTLKENFVKVRIRLADAARSGQWQTALEILVKNRDLINSSRLGGTSLFAPLHQAAYGGASAAVVSQLIDLGAWRTLRNASGQRALDVAEQRGHHGLRALLTPELKHGVPIAALLNIQTHFHDVIRARIDRALPHHDLRLPELEPLLELEQPQVWFPVPGMYGGFRYRLEAVGADPKLVSESWCRVAGGSGQRHEITSAGSLLVDEGFV